MLLPAETRLTVYRRRPFGRSRYILLYACPVLLRSGLSLVSRSGDSAPGPKETEDAERARETGTERLAQQAFVMICARVSRVILGAIPRLPLVGGHPSTMQTCFGVGTQDGRTTVQLVKPAMPSADEQLEQALYEGLYNWVCQNPRCRSEGLG